jgi:hypothetical protein
MPTVRLIPNISARFDGVLSVGKPWVVTLEEIKLNPSNPFDVNLFEIELEA